MGKSTKFANFMSSPSLSRIGFLIVLAACIIGMVTAIVVPSVTARARSADNTRKDCPPFYTCYDYDYEYYYYNPENNIPPELDEPPTTTIPNPPTVPDDSSNQSNGSNGNQPTPDVAALIFIVRPFNGTVRLGESRSAFFIHTKHAIIEMEYNEEIIEITFTPGNFGPTLGEDIIVHGLRTGTTTLSITARVYSDGQINHIVETIQITVS